MHESIKGYRVIRYATYSQIVQKTRNYAYITHAAYMFIKGHNKLNYYPMEYHATV